jgi:hypothetical protein
MILKIDFRGASQVIYEIDYRFIFPIILANVLCIYLRSVRWWYLLEPVKKLTFYKLFSFSSIGDLGNMVFPVRMGELIKALALRKKEKIPFSNAITTIFVARIFDSAILFLIVIFTLSIATSEKVIEYVPTGTKEYILYISVSLFIIFLVIYIIACNSENIDKLLSVDEHSGIRRRIRSMLSSAVSGSLGLRNPRNLFYISFSSVLIWLITLLTTFFFALMVGLDPSLETVFVITTFTIGGVAVPSSPGYIGTFHLAVIIALGLYGLDENFALGYAIIYHMLLFFPTVILGLFFLWKERLALSDLKHASEALI